MNGSSRCSVLLFLTGAPLSADTTHAHLLSRSAPNPAFKRSDLLPDDSNPYRRGKRTLQHAGNLVTDWRGASGKELLNLDSWGTVEGVKKQEQALVPPTRIERATNGLGISERGIT
jgi:hypothetical protein